MERQGKLVRVDFGPGAWVLEADDGSKLQLAGEIPSNLVGQRVSVKGKTVTGMGFAMLGHEMVEVRSVRRV